MVRVIFDIMKKTPDLNQLKKQVMQLLMSKMNMMDMGKEKGHDYGNMNMNNYPSSGGKSDYDTSSFHILTFVHFENRRYGHERLR